MRDTIDMAREAGIKYDLDGVWGDLDQLERLVALVRADERMSFYGQDKPAECADGCPPNQICDYCQVVAPAKAMILAEREACAKVCSEWSDYTKGIAPTLAERIRARGNT